MCNGVPAALKQVQRDEIFYSTEYPKPESSDQQVEQTAVIAEKVDKDNGSDKSTRNHRNVNTNDNTAGSDSASDSGFR